MNVLWVSQQTSHVFLATAIVLVTDKNGVKRQCRAVLDSGSKISFVSKKLASELGLPHEQVRQPVSGIGASCVQSRARVTLTVESRLKKFSTKLVCYMLPAVVENLPSCPSAAENWEIQTKYLAQLADPSFESSGPVNLLIGGGTFFELLEANRVRIGHGSLYLQDTKFGWVLVGEIGAICLFNVQSVGQSLEEDWIAIDQGKESKNACPSKANRKSLDEKEAVRHFQETAKRNPEGRFLLRLPLKPEVKNLGGTLNMDISRFLSVERRLQQNETLRDPYVGFMTEYKGAGHVYEVDKEEPSMANCFTYLTIRS